MADYKILQNIDLAQNEIKEVSKISNNIRSDNKDKGLCIQTGEDTSLTLNRKVGKNSNYIKGVVKEGTSNSVFNVKPSEINISNTKDTTSSSLVLGLDSKGNEHIESVSPLVDIKTGDTEYTDPHISLSQGSLNLKSTKISLNSKEEDTLSSLTMNEGITEKSDTITLQSVSKPDKLDTNDYFKVSLNKTTESKGEISLSARDSITESVGTRSVSIGTSDIVIKDSTTSSTESEIEVNDSGIVASKGTNSSITLGSGSLEEQSNTVTIKTPNNVTLELKETSNSATLNSKGTITLTSNKGTTNKEASTTYGNNSIVSKADSIKLQTQGYKDTSTTKFPHIELTSDTTNNSILVEGKTINISSKDSDNEDSDNEDTINLSGTKLNIKNTTTEITSSTINVTKETKDNNTCVLNIDTITTPKVTIPFSTTVDINSNTIGIGDTNSTTTISGNNLSVGTEKTFITSTSTLSGTTTLQSSKSYPKNTLVVNGTSTSITGTQVDINPGIVNIGTTGVVGITIGSATENTSTTLESKTTNINSPTLSVTSSTVKFGEGTNQEVSFNGSGSVTSNVDTSVVGKTFSVKNGSTNILKADTTSVSLAGSSTSITSRSVSIGTNNTTSITIGRNTDTEDTEDTNTILTSKITNITSPTVNIGTETTTSLSIGNKTASTVNLSGNINSDLSITSDTTTSTVKAKNLNFTENLVGNGIKIYWDTTSSSLVFAKE